MGTSKRNTSSRRRTQQRRVSVWAFVAALLFLLGAYLLQSDIPARLGIDLPFDLSSDPAATSPATTLTRPLDGEVEVFFTTPYLVYPDEPGQRTPPPHEQALLADLDAAQTSIAASLFEYNLESIAEALVRAQERGVTVRLALDRENLEDPDDAFWAGLVEEAGIPISWQDTTAFQHSKFFIIDNKLVWTGSWNATVNGTYRNNNNLLRINLPTLAENYATEFEQMFGGSFGNQKISSTPHPLIRADDMRIENYFSPRDGVAPHVVERVAQAESSIRFLTFSFTSDEIGEAMLARHEDGVQVQGVFENRNATGIGAEFERLEASGADVWKDGNCYTMHHKVIIIDDSTVITGSYNFTQRAEDTNDENLLIIDSPEIAQQYLTEFERVYSQAQQPTRCGS